MSEFITWIADQLKKREWGHSQLGRHADLASGTVSNVMSERAKPGFSFCMGIAKAFDMPPEDVLRLAGLLPPLVRDKAEEEMILELLRRLSPQRKAALVEILRAMVERVPDAQEAAPYVSEGEMEVVLTLRKLEAQQIETVMTLVRALNEGSDK